MLRKCKVLIVLILMLSGMAVSSSPVSAAEEKGFVYEIINGKVRITDYIGSEKVVEIPSTLNGMPVTNIGVNAFAEKGLTKVTIPKSVTSIEATAFFENRLTSIVIPESVTSVGSYAFAGNSLTNVKLSHGLISLDNHSFSYNNIKSLVIPDSVTSIYAHAFHGNELTELVIGNKVKFIGSCAFWGNQLVSVKIPKSVTYLEGEDVFSGMKREGYIFDKWYLDQKYTKVWDQSTGGVTIYAKKIDTIPPILSINQVSDQSTTIAGTTEAKATVKLYLNGKLQNTTATADSKGKYTFKISKQKPGVTVKVVASDAAKNETTKSTTVVDKTAPTLTINQVHDNSTTITGTTEAKATVKLYLNGKLQNTTATADSKGKYTFKISKQKPGVVVKVVAFDAAKNETTKSTTVVDKTAPVLSVNQVNDNSTTITGTTETKATVKLYLNGKLQNTTATADSKGKYTFKISKQKPGVVVKVVAFDAAKNETTKSTTVGDKTAPTLTINQVSDQSTTITGTTEAKAIVKLYLNGKLQNTTATADSKGKYTFKISKQKAGVTVKVVASDAAKNETTKLSKVVDKTAPALTINQVHDKSTAITGTTEAKATVKLYLNGKLQKTTATADSKGKYTFKISKQKAGIVVKVVASDAVKNTTTKSTKVLDKTAPAIPTVKTVKTTTTKVTGTAEKNATVYVYNGKTKLGTAKVNAKGSYSVSIKKQKNGSKLTIYVKDVAGNQSKSRTVTVKK